MMKTNINQNFTRQFTQQKGAALFVALILLLILTIIGLSASQRSQLQEKMAANLHIQNVAFNAAESALRSYVAESNGLTTREQNPAVPWTGHIDNFDNILRETRDQGVLADVCYDQNGMRGACGARFIDSGNSVEARVSAQVISDCQLCAGFSMDIPVKCREYLITATGTVGGAFGTPGTQSEQHQLWAYETTACN